MKIAWPKTLILILLIFPVSDNYRLETFGFGGGGSSGSSSDAYSAEMILGETSSYQLIGGSYMTNPGLLYTQFADTPPEPTFTNDGTFTNKLRLTVDVGNNPLDAEYAVAISTDNFTTTSYVQSDNTVGATLGDEDWQTFTDWGGATGEYVVGLDADTTYFVKVKARQGDYSEGFYSGVATAATSTVTLSFDIDVSSSDTETSTPYAIDLGSLTAGSVTVSSDKVWVDLTTNAAGGGAVYVYGSNAGLLSSATGYTIPSVSANLTPASEGFGLHVDTVSESSGGPMAGVSPYSGGAGHSVGLIDTTPQVIFNSSSAPVTSGRASFLAKVKIKQLTPAANDYTETLTVIAAGSF